jgi:hypothetical protein
MATLHLAFVLTMCVAVAAAAPAEDAGPPVKSIASFEQGNPFNGGTVVALHATGGSRALRIDRSYAAMLARQDWSGYDYLKVDTYTDAQDPLPLTIEIRDTGTRDYWTRVNYRTVVPPGRSTLTLPLKQLYVGEKGRPGRSLILNGITRLVLALEQPPPAPLFVEAVRLERDLTGRKAFFDGLHAFDFGTESSPVMPGFTAVTPATRYSPARGYGLKNARIWRAMDALQPDPLYEDFICIESGGLAVDLPNGKYRVFVNMDSPAGFWGEYQSYRERSILAQGKPVVVEEQDFKSFQKRYFHFWDQEDLPTDNTFEKYDRAHFQGKVFDVVVNNAQLYLEFKGENWACSVSAVIVFPVEKAAEGGRFLEYVREKRRFYYDNAFKRVLHRPAGDPLRPTAEDARRGYVLFQRELMKDVYYNDTPTRDEPGGPLVADAFAGQESPLSLAVLPLQDLGPGTLTVSSLTGPGGVISARDIDVGYVSHRLSRVTGDGAVYTISPRLIIPRNRVELPKGIARQFWLTVHIPAGASPGVYAGQATIKPERGLAASIPLRVTVRKGKLDAVDIPVGPWGGQIGTPWIEGDFDTIAFGEDMTRKSLRVLRAHGFTMFSGIPRIVYKGFTNGKPELDFDLADRQMREAKALGFLAVNSYGAGIRGLDPYYEDLAKMKAAGFTSYSAFIKALYTAVKQHAQAKDWLPVYWNIGDEPSSDALPRAIENATAYRDAFPSGPPFFTAATTMHGNDKNDAALRLASTVHVANLNGHDEAGLKLLQGRGGEWAFYNGGNRWTYGVYLYKAAKEFHLRFRLAWHWNLVAGDPYYALDCREDDAAWANATPDRQLAPSVEFIRIGAGLDDYRSLLTLARLAKEKAGTPAAKAAERLIGARMAAFHLGDRDHDRLFGVEDWAAFRERLDSVIEALQ